MITFLPPYIPLHCACHTGVTARKHVQLCHGSRALHGLGALLTGHLSLQEKEKSALGGALDVCMERFCEGVLDLTRRGSDK